jgi:hypothetical protein
MTSRLPSLRAVAIFVAAGRALSFTEAAKAVRPDGVALALDEVDRLADAREIARAGRRERRLSWRAGGA